MTAKAQFTIQKTHWKARLWTYTLRWIEVKTPAFMPVWTKSTIKWIPLEWMTKEYLWTETDVNIILNNTFHLYLRPWDETIKHFWWVHKFQNRDKLILTDSWWFQVFSLWLSKGKGKSLVKLQDDWVWFSSPHDWSRHFFSPKWVVDIQRNFWCDIMMMLDVCSPVHEITKREVARQLQITHNWAKEAYDYHMEWYDQHNWVLFPIVQWGLYEDLREESLEALIPFAKDWIAVWWLSVWETRDELARMTDFIWEKLPEDKVRYLMGLWTPKELRQAIYAWFDIFDCVVPTRLWRHWWAFVWDEILKIKNAQYKQDTLPLDPECKCHTCRNFTRWYLHHLLREGEMMWWTLKEIELS